MRRFAGVVILLALPGGALRAQINRTACAVSPAAEKEVLALPPLDDLSWSWDERMAPRRALARNYPDDWALQILVQDAIRGRFYLGREWDQAIDHYRSLPDKTLGELLEARLLSGLHRKRSREMLDHALAAAPDSPWVHLALLEWIARPGAAGAAAEPEFERFRRLCPESLRVFQYLESVRDPDRLYAHLTALRRAIDAKQGAFAEEDFGLFRPLWTWEKALYGAGRAEEFRARVRRDLAALRARPGYDSQGWYAAVRLGYDLYLKDTAALEDLRKEILERAPGSLTAGRLVEDEWRGRGGGPHPDAGALLRQIERFPGRPFLLFPAQALLLSPQSKLTPEQVERLADFVLSAAERFPDQSVSWPPVSMLVAGAYVRRKVRLDDVPRLVQKALEDIEQQEKYRRGADIFGNANTERRVDNLQEAQERAREALVRHALATGRKDRALALLDDMRRELEESKPADTARIPEDWARKQARYLALRKEAGLDAEPIAEFAPPFDEGGKRHPVEDFEARDLSGRTWRLSDLKGKVAYVNIWTSWCAPCRAEMPALQKLHDRWKDRKDRLVLTISADLHPALAESFLKETSYSFPVIHGAEIAAKFFPPVYFPQNWLIDPQGRRLEARAPRAGEAALARIEELADKLAAAAP